MEIECEKEGKIILNGGKIKEVNEFKYLGSLMCKHGGTDGAKRRGTARNKGGRSLRLIMNGRSVSMEVKRDLRNTIIVQPSHMQMKHGPGIKVRFRVQAVKRSYLRSACGGSGMDGMSNESVYERFGMCQMGEGKPCGVVEEVKRQTLKWFGHME